ncbi:MAG TPA: hypothetical protein VHL53_11575, partial [Acidimicrobiia bacterium]|nr:hypothetical protein [Acidimicrobiia bacterium]
MAGGRPAFGPAVPFDRNRWLAALAVVTLLGGFGAALGKAVGTGRGVLGATGGSSGGGGGGQAGGSGHSNSNGSSNSNSNGNGSSYGNSSNGGSGSNSNDHGGGGSGTTGPGGGTGTTGNTVAGNSNTRTHPTAPGAAVPSGGGPATTAPKSPPTTIPVTQSTIPQNLPKEAAPTRPVACPANVPASPAGGRVRCYQVTGGSGNKVTVVGVPGIPVPLPVPVPIVAPVINDTGDSNSNHVDNRVTVYVDIDNRAVVDGDAYGRRGQRALATLALLIGLPVLAVAVVLVLRRG